MGRVRGEREAIASSTNSWGIGLRRFAENGETAGGSTGELLRGLGIQCAGVRTGGHTNDEARAAHSCFQQLRYISRLSCGEWPVVSSI